LLRYVLERCSTTAEAIETLSRIPIQMVNNVMVLDMRGDHAPAGDRNRRIVGPTDPIGRSEWIALSKESRNCRSDIAR
jgi:predicted choloylglycine hydrolase